MVEKYCFAVILIQDYDLIDALARKILSLTRALQLVNNRLTKHRINAHCTDELLSVIKNSFQVKVIVKKRI